MRRQKGFVLIAMSAAMLLMLAMLGLAFDFGRIYIARNEAQVFTDAAALAAIRELDGTGSGLKRAQDAVRQLPIRWNLGSQKFENVRVEFSADRKSWSADPDDVIGLAYARVTAPENSVSITFLRAVGGPESFAVPARSIAALHPVRLVE